MLNLNAPPCESTEPEGTSTEANSQQLQANQQEQPTLPAPIDVEAIDDDVIESSPRAFAEVIHYLFVLFLLLQKREENFIDFVDFHVRLRTIPEEIVGGLL